MDYKAPEQPNTGNGFRGNNNNLNPFLFNPQQSVPDNKYKVSNKPINYSVKTATADNVLVSKYDESSIKDKNIIEILRHYGDSKSISYAFTYAFLFVMDTVDSYIFEGIDKLKKTHKNLYRHNIKKWLQGSQDASQWIMRYIKKYTNEAEDDVFYNLDNYQDRFQKEVFILYNVMLRQSANRWFKNDYDLAVTCTKLDMANILVEYWMKMSRNVAYAFPHPLCNISNDYDAYLKKICAGIRNFITDKNVLPNIEVYQLNENEQGQFKGAFGTFVKVVTQIFNEMLYDKMSDEYKVNRTENQESDGSNETHRTGA